MATGLIALLDDVAAIAKVAAASIDDVGVQAVKAGGKAAGVVIDDAAVTPRYATGFAADRELPIIWRIAVGSLRNKLLFLLPAALALSEFAPWGITPLLMIGGLYLCFEGAEKLWELVSGHGHDEAKAESSDPETLEKAKVNGAIQTDFILSAEIMAIALASVEDPDLIDRAIILTVVGIGITIAVYGVVAFIVKADDVGLALARPGRPAPVRALGRGLVKGMPPFLRLLGIVGTVAMLWVGGGIIAHGAGELGWHGPEKLLEAVAATGHALPALPGLISWVLHTIAAASLGAALGAGAILVLRIVLPSRAAHSVRH